MVYKNKKIQSLTAIGWAAFKAVVKYAINTQLWLPHSFSITAPISPPGRQWSEVLNAVIQWMHTKKNTQRCWLKKQRKPIEMSVRAASKFIAATQSTELLSPSKADKLVSPTTYGKLR